MQTPGVTKARNGRMPGSARAMLIFRRACELSNAAQATSPTSPKMITTPNQPTNRQGVPPPLKRKPRHAPRILW